MNHKFTAISAAINHDFDLSSRAGLNGLPSGVAEESVAINAKPSEWLHRHQRGTRVRMVGLVKAAENAAAALTATTGASLPWNLNKTYKGWVDHESITAADRKVEDWKRWTGFLNEVAGHPKQYPLLVAFIKATQSGNGTGSPYTTCELRALVEKFSFSPGRLERVLRSVEWQCNRFLRGYGIQFSHKRDWDSMASVLSPRITHTDTEDGWGPQWCGDRDRSGFNPAKAGKKLAADILNEHLERISGQKLVGKPIEVLMRARGFRWILPKTTHRKKQGYPFPQEIVEWVHPHSRQVVRWAVDRINAGEFAHLREAIHFSDRLVLDNRDGVELLIDPGQTRELHGFRVTPGYHLVSWGRSGRRQCVEMTHLVVGPTGRAFRAQYGLAVRRDYASLRGSDPTSRGYIREAIYAWQKQDNANKLALKQFPHLRRTDCTMLVTDRDFQWARTYSISVCDWAFRKRAKTWCVPAKALFGEAADPNVARVLTEANRAAARLSA